MLKKRHPKIFQTAKALQKIESFKRHDSSRSQNSVRIAHLYNLTEEEYSLVLKETNCPDPFRVAALNVYRDITREIVDFSRVRRSDSFKRFALKVAGLEL